MKYVFNKFSDTEICLSSKEILFSQWVTCANIELMLYIRTFQATLSIFSEIIFKLF